MEGKSPLLAFILNTVLPGVGYIYIGKRMRIAVPIVILNVFYLGLIIGWGVMGRVYQYGDLELIDGLAIGLIFGYDAYKVCLESD